MVRTDDGGPSLAADPVSHLCRLAAKEDLAVAIHRISDPACVATAEARIQESITSAVRQATSNPLDPGCGRAFDPSAIAPTPISAQAEGELGLDA